MKQYSCSEQKVMSFALVMNLKMPTILGICPGHELKNANNSWHLSWS